MGNAYVIPYPIKAPERQTIFSLATLQLPSQIMCSDVNSMCTQEADNDVFLVQDASRWQCANEKKNSSAIHSFTAFDKLSVIFGGKIFLSFIKIRRWGLSLPLSHLLHKHGRVQRACARVCISPKKMNMIYKNGAFAKREK